MAEAGIGVDLVEISRMERIMRQTPGFFPRMFTEEERAYCEGTARPAAHYACRFAAREAVLKALGTGFGQEGVGRNDVSVSKDANGRPVAVLSGGAQAVAQRLGVLEVALSLSFTGELAIANAMAITAEARPQPKEERLTERQRIAQSFREVRSVLDELERVEDPDVLLAKIEGDANDDVQDGASDTPSDATRAAEDHGAAVEKRMGFDEALEARSDKAIEALSDPAAEYSKE